MRLIDADELLQRIQHEELQMAIHGREFSTCFNSQGGTPSTEWWYVEDLIENAPTITPERKRGRWVPQDHNKKNGMITTAVYYCPTCSVCGKTGDYNMSFCPNCGADMRGAKDDES